MMDWHANLSKQIYASKLFQYARTHGAMTLDWINVILSNLLARSVVIRGLLIDRAGKVQNIMFSSAAGPLLIAGVNMTNEVGEKGMEMARNGVDILTAVMRYNILMMRGTVLVVDGIIRGTIKEMKHWSVDAMEKVVQRGSSVISGRVSATKKAVTGATQASITTVGVVLGTTQHVVTGIVTMGESIGRLGMNGVRNVWCANTRILLRISTTSQNFLPGSKYLFQLSSLFGVPYIWITTSCHGTQQQQQQQQHPEPATATAISLQDLQETTIFSKVCHVMSFSC